MTFNCQFETPPDKEGKRRFCLTWINEGGIYLPELSKVDNKPIGFRYGQYFYTNPEKHFKHLRENGHAINLIND